MLQRCMVVSRSSVACCKPLLSPNLSSREHDFLGVGEHTREGNDLYYEMIETGAINLEGDSKVALVFENINEPPGAHAYVALTDLSIAEYFRDEEGQDVLLFIDSGLEVLALLGRIPSAVGDEPTLPTDMGSM